MLLVPTFIAKSPIHGIGLFAAERIEQGAAWWMLDPSFDQVLTPQQVGRLPSRAREHMLEYAYVASGAWVLCSDHGRFVNHSFTPNSFTVGSFSCALRTIERFEEITEDYRDFFDKDHWHRFPFLADETVARLTHAA
jgi:SET domain-containing protein